MFADILAEIREYGEGFIIVDQVPAKLTPDALKNTYLKILHRIVAEDDYRGGRGGYRSYIRMESLLTQAIQAMSGADTLSAGTAESIVAFLAEMRGQLAREPHRREPGCRLRQRPCWYGYIVQRDLAARSKALAARLQIASKEPGFEGNFERLAQEARTFSQDATPFTISVQHFHALAFCYLVNSGAQRSHVLQGFQDAQATVDAQ